MATAYIPYRAKKCKFYVNGDTKFLGKQCVVNPKRTRNFDAFLQELTNNLKTTRPIRNICTPVGGHRVKDLEELVNNGNYVAVSGDKFKKVGYLEMGAGLENFKKGSQSPRNMEVKPVEHSRLWRSSGRIRKIPTTCTTMFVYRNGQDLTPPARVTLTHQMLRYGWDSVFTEIQNRLRPTMNGAPKKLTTTDGQTIDSTDDIKNMESYVLVCMGDYKGFKKGNYGRSQPPPFHTSPRMSRKNYHGVRLEPISKQRRGRKDDSDSDSYPTSTGTGGSDKSSTKTAKSTPIKKPAENRPKPRREPKKEEDGVFHAKPVKHKRTPENTKQVDFDKDEGGVFKSKQKNRDTAGAQEIDDTDDTKVDLPIDQVQAEEVEEEIQEEKEVKKYHTPTPPPPKERTLTPKNRTPTPKDRTPTPQTVRTPTPENKTDPKQEKAATTIQAGARGYLARKEVAKKREEKKEKEAAATTIQAGYRGYRDRQKVKGLKDDAKPKEQEEQPEEVPEEVAKEEPPAEELNDDKDKEKAATTIQAGYRGYKDREKVKAMKETDAKNKAATKIQAGVRGHQDRKKVKAIKQDQAATKIQAGVRGHQDRKKVKAMKEEKQKRETAVVTIQAGYRGYKDRQKVKAMKGEQQESST